VKKVIHCTDGHNCYPRPGLGFMIAALAEAALYAVVTGRDLVVDWRDTLYQPRSQVNLFAELFEPRSFEGVGVFAHDLERWREGRSRFVVDDHYYWKHIANWEDGDLASRYELWRKNAGFLQRARARWFSRLVCPGDDGFAHFPLIGKAADVIFAPFVGAVLFSRLSEESIPGRFVRSLRPVSAHRRAIREFKGRHFAGKHVVGLHVRHGNGEGGEFVEAGRTMGDPRSFLETVAVGLAALPVVKDRGASVFLCSDSDEVVEMARNVFPDLITRSQWRPAPGTGCSLHQGHLCPEGSVANAANALIDIFLLGSCDLLVQTDSPRTDSTSWFWQVAAKMIGSGKTVRLSP
jgi:hypothetical protein